MTSVQSPDNASQTDSVLLRPADAARQLGIPASTLRRWSRRFAAFLSAEANGAVHADGGRGHRRYAPRDLAVLARCKALLSEGRTFEQTARELETAFQPDALTVTGEIDLDENEPVADIVDAEEPLEMMRGEDALDLGQLMAQTLSSLSGSQQMIITGQQTERELLGVVLQDNFNLKEDNKKLRERMVETERRIFEMKREMAKAQTEERERMRQMEAYLFQLQRQMDDLVRRPAPPVAFTPTVMPVQPVQLLTAPPQQLSEATDAGAKGEALASASADAPAPGKRSFWEWLFGR